MSEQKVRIRPIERDDLPFLRDLANDPEVRENVVGWDWPLSLADQENWFDAGPDTRTTRRFIVENEQQEPIGLTGLWDIDWRNMTAMSGIKLGGRPSARGRGYGTQTLHVIMDFAFHDVGLRRLYAPILEFNHASLAIYLRKTGWTQEGVSRQHVWRRGRYWDVIHVGIFRDEYLTTGDNAREASSR